MDCQLELARLSKGVISKFGNPRRSIHVFVAQDKWVGRRKGTTVTGKSGQTEAGRNLGDGVQGSLPYI